MKPLRLMRWLVGEVSFQGEIIDFYSQPEVFLNLLSQKGIRTWNIVIENGKLSGMADCHFYRELVQCGKKAGIRIHKKEKKGAPFLLHRYRKRWGLGFGIILLLGGILYSQQFIWQVEFPEMEPQKLTYLSNMMEEMGLCQGAYIPHLDLPALQREILQKREDFAWITFHVDGTKLVVDLSEKITSPEKNEKAPFHVLAGKTGQILSAEIYAGKSLVKVGDVVEKGDLLVSGVVDVPRGEGVYYTNASAKVIAATSTAATLRFSLIGEERIFTGEEKTRSYLSVLGFRIPLFLAFPLEEAVCEKRYTPLKWNDTALPFGMVRETYRFYRLEERIYTEEEGRTALKEGFAVYEAEQHSHCKILHRADRFQREGDYLLLTRKYDCEEDIAKQVSFTVTGEYKTKY